MQNAEADAYGAGARARPTGRPNKRATTKRPTTTATTQPAAGKQHNVFPALNKMNYNWRYTVLKTNAFQSRCGKNGTKSIGKCIC